VRSLSTFSSSSMSGSHSVMEGRILGAPFGGVMSPSDISSSLISQLAVVALKLRLADHQGVFCDVSANPTDLLFHGRAGPITVKGRGWKSGLGLTCRSIEATVSKCELDLRKMLELRKLRLVRPAEGKATIALNGKDFSNFITHPFIRPPVVGEAEARLQFLPDEAVINSQSRTVSFFASYNNRRWRCILSRGSNSRSRAIVDVVPSEELSMVEDERKAISVSLTNFFNDLVFELDGTYLAFSDMMIPTTASAPSVMLSLNIRVRKFPSAGLEF
jgi:hypothetical protein